MNFKTYLKESGGGAALSDQLASKLARANVPKEVITALRAAMAHSDVDPYAQTYAQAMTKSYEGYGVDGVKHQVMYLLLNLAKWKGDEARDSKKILRKWSSS